MGSALIHHKIINDWEINSVIKSNVLERYYILHWNPHHFFNKLYEGKINHQDVDYLVVYHRCTPSELRKQSEIVLSFRKMIDGIDIPNYVLVSKI